MISKALCYSLAISLSLSCSTVPRVPAPAPTSVPQAPSEIPPSPLPDNISRGPWTFAYTPGRITYIVNRNTIVQRTDSIANQDPPSKSTTLTNTTREVLTFEPGSESIRITAGVDSFTPLPSDSSVQLELHPQLSAVLALNALSIDKTDTTACNPIRSALTSDVRNLVVPFPDSLTPGLTWKDSVDVEGCQAGISTLSQITRSFTVRGQVPIQGRVLLEILRSDTTRLKGEGGLQRHRVSIQAFGTGSGTYYLDIRTGQLLRLDVSQAVTIDVATLATKSRFEQKLEQVFVLSP
jgi:hypothetical protein